MLQSQDRLLLAAKEIHNIFRKVNDLEATLKNPLMAFSVYVAALVFLEAFVSDHNHQSEENLNFLYNILIAVGRTSAISKSLAIQLAMDMRQSGFDASALEKVKGLYSATELIPLLTKRDSTTSNVMFCVQASYIPLQTMPILSTSEQFVSDGDLTTVLPWLITMCETNNKSKDVSQETLQESSRFSK
ncbi:hypothetical protein V495_00960 [Pseudogymnoascus sp. VKM F-4514 (FW-929)]|nr:hypothetical protein V495_00960 [Pseudogymnoascus sp. VKM F-4514 (FW-929)]